VLTLGIDTATRTGGVALANGGRVIRSLACPLRLAHSESVLPMIDRLLEEAGSPLDAVAAVAVAAGPGSFTGLRVGLATARGLALGCGIPLVAVPTMEALALPFEREESPVWVLLPSKRDHVFTGLFRWVGEAAERRIERLRPERNQRLEEFLSELNVPAFVTGPGLAAVESELAAVGSGTIRIDERSRRESDGSGVAVLGERLALAGAGRDPRLARPFYVVEQVAKPLPEFPAGNGG